MHFSLRSIICMLIILTILILTSCQNQVDVSSLIDTKEIQSYISYQQCNDGGFADSISLSIIDYNDYYDTYCSLYILDLLDFELSDEQHSRAIDFIEKIDIDTLIGADNNLDMVFFYLRIADILDYKLPEKQFRRIIDYISSLQTADGYFVNSTANRELLSKGELQIEMLGSVNLVSLANIIELGTIYELDIDYNNLARYLDLFLTEKNVDSKNVDSKNVDFNSQFENLQIAAAALLIKTHEIWNIPMNDDSILKVKKLYTNRRAWSP